MLKSISKMRATAVSFARDEEGLEMVEWAIVAALLSTGAGLSFLIIGPAVGSALLRLQLVTASL